jgi:hypothetical protein
MMKQIAAFLNSVKAPKNVGLLGLRRNNHASTLSSSRGLGTSFQKAGPDWQGCDVPNFFLLKLTLYDLIREQLFLVQEKKCTKCV